METQTQTKVVSIAVDTGVEVYIRSFSEENLAIDFMCSFVNKTLEQVKDLNANENMLRAVELTREKIKETRHKMAFKSPDLDAMLYVFFQMTGILFYFCENTLNDDQIPFVKLTYVSAKKKERSLFEEEMPSTLDMKNSKTTKLN